MTEKPPSSRNAGHRTLTGAAGYGLWIGLGLMAVWSFARYGLRLFSYLRAELLLNVRTDIVDRDFANYWVGGKLVRAGHPDLLFDHDGYYAILKLLFGNDYQIHSWSYPPHFLMLIAPLGWLDYVPALGLFLAVTLALFVWATRQFVRRYSPEVGAAGLSLALTGFVLAMIDATQNGFLTSALLLFAFAFMRDRPVVAGFALALLTTKPQLGFLVALLALYDRNWRIFGWTILFTIALVGTSLALFGIQPWIGYFEKVIPYQNFVMMKWEGGFLWFMPSAFGSARLLGFAPAVALAIHGAVALLALAVLVRLLAALRDPLERVFAVVAATFLITPYAFSYDMGAYCVVAACLMLRAHAAGHATRAWILALTVALPAYMPLLAWKNVPVSPLLIGAAFGLLCLKPNKPDAPPVSEPS